jgi:hypothetical protein
MMTREEELEAQLEETKDIAWQAIAILRNDLYGGRIANAIRKLEEIAEAKDPTP